MITYSNDFLKAITFDELPKTVNLVNAFDIETTTIYINNEPQSFCYLWSFQLDNEITRIGRTLEDFKIFIDELKNISDKKIIIYVFNLSYEFQFLKSYFHFGKVFAVDSRKVLYCEYENIVFKDAYLHSNTSLREYLKKWNVDNQKLDGAKFNYKKKRYPWTKINDYELQYSINDVKGLVQALKKEMRHDGDTLETIPLTSTGYIRREVKHIFEKIPYYEKKNQQPNIEVFEKLREAFKGGNNHANRLYSNVLLEKVKSVDISSAYPSMLIMKKFPYGKWKKRSVYGMNQLKYDMNHDRALLLTFECSDIRIKKGVWCPSISISKAIELIHSDESDEFESLDDNGRLLAADYLKITMTEIDFKIFINQYNFNKLHFVEVYSTYKKHLPKPFRDYVLKLYKDKTELKGLEDKYNLYMKSKEKINACYGMMVQNPAKESARYDYEAGEWVNDKVDIDLVINKLNKRPFLNYAWGVWITSYTREQLQNVIDLTGDNFVYCDTDSVKYLQDDTIDKKIAGYNNELYNRAKEFKTYAKDIKNNIHYMGVFEDDGFYDEFKTLGAKKYCYIENGKLHLTCAGVNKKAGAEELRSISCFKVGFIFKKGGGTESRYHDNVDILYKPFKTRPVIKIKDNISIIDSTYKLGLSDEYERMLSNVDFFERLEFYK